MSDEKFPSLIWSRSAEGCKMSSSTFSKTALSSAGFIDGPYGARNSLDMW